MKKQQSFKQICQQYDLQSNKQQYLDVVPAGAHTRLLKESPGYLYDTNYVRYLLSFKLWKKLAGKERFAAINKEAILKLKPPPDFVEKLKCGAFANVLPYVSKSEKDRLTSFFMQSPFNVKMKAEVFLKDSHKNLPSGEYDHLSLEEDFDSSNLFEYNDTEQQEHDSSLEIMNTIWGKLFDKESHSIDDLFCSDSLEEDNMMMIDLKTSSVEESLEISTNSVLKAPRPKRFKMDHSENNILLIDSPGKPNSLLIGTIPKEEKITASCIKAEDTLNSLINSECKSKRCLNSEATKIKKPCATVEPEKCKEMEADSQSQTEIHRTITSVLSSNENGINIDTNHIVENMDGQESQTVVSSENNLFEKNSTEVNCAEIVHSSCEDQMCANEEVDQLKTNTNNSTTLIPDVGVLVCTEETYHEVVNPGAPLDKPMNGDLQSNKLDQKNFFSAIGVINDLVSIVEHGINVASTDVDTSNKTSDPKNVSPIEKQKSASDKNEPKTNNTKDTTSTTSPENQFLSSIVASSENCDNYVSLRQDSYTCNDLMLTQLFSEVNADEGSDDDNRFHNQRQYADGGKIRAFRDQTEESKSESEEFETHSPAKHTDSIKSVDEASPNSNHQLNLIHPNVVHSEEVTSVKSNQEKEAVLSEKPDCPINSNLDCPHLKRVSIDVSYVSKSESVNPVLLVNNEKISSKEKRVSSRHRSTLRKKIEHNIVAESSGSDNDMPILTMEGGNSLSETIIENENSKKKPCITRQGASTRSQNVHLIETPAKASEPPMPTICKSPVKKKRRRRRR